MKAFIALEDGAIFEGRAFAGKGEVYGELVFNTSMTGYQEILTDPSYYSQVVTLCYPLIGNYGINAEDEESRRPHAAGLVIGECSRIPSNWRHGKTLEAYLEEHGVLGVDDIDTRAVTLHIRRQGAMKCVVSTEDQDRQNLVEKARNSTGLVGRDLAGEVSTATAYDWPGPYTDQQAFAVIEQAGRKTYDAFFNPELEGRFPFRIAVLDCGVKVNQLRLMARYGCALRVFPYNTPADEILAWQPDGFFISNGPGDPEGVPQAVSAIRGVIEKQIPTFGICFGHQLLCLALGGSTYKLKFGHRGGNQPVQDLRTGKVDITSQNHGFCVDLDSLDSNTIEPTHINLNDRTCEGIRHKVWPLFSVQYHPEACPGPHDSTRLFTDFMHSIGDGRT